eukprot:SAG31_NODE_4256_length_3414_cov_2.193665_4_plen_87_part_00
MTTTMTWGSTDAIGRAEAVGTEVQGVRSAAMADGWEPSLARAQQLHPAVRARRRGGGLQPTCGDERTAAIVGGNDAAGSAPGRGAL